MTYLTSRIHVSKPFALLFFLSLLSYMGAALLLTPYITHAAGNTYYASPNGSGSTCSQNSPCSLNTGLSQTQAGDTLYLRQGSYGTISHSSLNSGTSWSNPVTIASAPGETATVFSLYLESSSPQYIIFDRLIFDSEKNQEWPGVSVFIEQAKYIRVQNSDIRNAYNIGVTMGAGASFNEVINCDIHHNGHLPYTPPDYAYGLYISADNNLFDGIRVHDNDGYGYHGYSGGGGDDNNIIRNSLFYNNGLNTPNSTSGLLIGSGTNNMAYNNVSYNNQKGIAVAYGSNNKVYNNTTYGNRDGGIVIYSSSGDIVRNNIAYNNGSAYGDISNDAGATLSHNLTTDPLFISSSDFHLQSTSPAKDAGTTLPEVPCDFDGNGRPAGGAYDIGAYEQGGTTGTGCTKGGGGATPTPPPTPMPLPPPVIYLSATPQTIVTPGGGTQVFWQVSNATSCTASGGWSGQKDPGGDTERYNPPQSTTYVLTCTGPGGTAQKSVTVTVGGGGAGCTKYSNGATTPQGFGVPWDVTTPSSLLLKADCTPPTIVLKVGDNANSTYVYKTGYVAPAGVTSWSAIDLYGGTLINQAWYVGFAQGIAQIQDITKASYYVAYTCKWTGSKWMCGCRDQACTQSFWQIQKIQQ